jgi:hypothetical protein
VSRAGAALAALALLAALPARGHGDDPLEDVAYLAGRWVGGEGQDLSEEIWSPRAGRSMMGMWRYVIGDAARVHELLTLTAEDGWLVLRLRHFDGKLVAREEKDQPLVLELVRRGMGTLRFEGPGAGAAGTVALTYQSIGRDRLRVTLERDGKAQAFEFRRASAR